MKVLIDGDVLLYRNLFAAEHKNYLIEHNGIKEFKSKKELNEYTKANNCTETEVWQDHQVEPLQFALSNIRNSIDAIRFKLKAEQESIYLSGRNNFRYRIATVRPYKGNRDVTHKPVYLSEGREWLQSKYGAIVVDGIEADDALGIEAAKNLKGSIIVTNDKDLKQIPCWHYNWTTPTEEPVYASPKDAGLFFFQQVLSGDATDNVPGIEGLGPTGARGILDGCKSVSDAETRVLGAYRDRYGKGEGDRRFLETARLVKIHTAEDEVSNLWKPSFVQLVLET